MKRKYFQWVVLFMMCYGMISCDKWLEVDPKLDINEETLFKNYQGYYTALNGLYLNLAEKELYGQNLSWGAVEAWGGGYSLQKNNGQGYIDLSKYDYQTEGAKSIATNIWQYGYNVIAEANNLIQNLEKDNNTTFPYGGDVVKNMILGEAYAIRAMVHFELVRIFAKAPIIDNGGVSAYIPFVDKYPSDVNAPVVTKDILTRVISDLEKAKSLVAPFDTLPENQGYIKTNLVAFRIKLDDGTMVGGIPDDEFFRYRANRMSYCPILQLLARVCLYAGNHDKAYVYASQIITMVSRKKVYDFVKPGYIGDPMTLSTVEPKLHSEMLFGSYNSKLTGIIGTSFTSNSSNRLRVADKANIFAENAADCRLKTIPRDISTKYTLEGKVMTQVTASQSLVPVLRFPECYYIAAEAIFKKDKSEAIKIFNNVVNARNNAKYAVNESISEQDFNLAIVKEYRREFLSEGVMIFVYKRLNVALKNNNELIANPNNLVMPAPDSESGIQ